MRATLKRLRSAGLNWPLPDDMTDAALEARLFAAAGTKQGHRRQAEPDWAAIHRELKRKHVTLTILWDEYIAGDPEGYRYSRFCELYRSWESKLSVTMRQVHVGGDKLFVDYAGDTVPVIIDRLTGETRPAQIFVAVMGASNFTYVAAHTHAFTAIGGVPHLLVPDNTKVAVIKACLDERRASWNGRPPLPAWPSIGPLLPNAALRLPGLCSWSCQFLSASRRTIAPHHRNPAEADRRWRGRGPCGLDLEALRSGLRRPPLTLLP